MTSAMTASFPLEGPSLTRTTRPTWTNRLKVEGASTGWSERAKMSGCVRSKGDEQEPEHGGAKGAVGKSRRLDGARRRRDRVARPQRDEWTAQSLPLWRERLEGDGWAKEEQGGSEARVRSARQTLTRGTRREGQGRACLPACSSSTLPGCHTSSLLVQSTVKHASTSTPGSTCSPRPRKKATS